MKKLMLIIAIAGFAFAANAQTTKKESKKEKENQLQNSQNGIIKLGQKQSSASVDAQKKRGFMSKCYIL